ncbi:type 3 dihydrofolate reductase [soil metagenome]
MFDIVVASDLDWGIGKTNALPWPKLKGDLQHFKRVTSAAPEGMRNAVFMGRKTFDSAEVQRRALPRRLNVIISRGAQDLPEGVLGATSIDGALTAIERLSGTAAAATMAVDSTAPAAHPISSTFCVGGGQIFKEALEHAALRYIYLTRVQGRFGCDVHIPDIDALGFTAGDWDGASEAEENGVTYRIERLARR